MHRHTVTCGISGDRSVRHATTLRLYGVAVVQLPAVRVRPELIDKTTTTDARHYTACVVVSATTKRQLQ